MKSIYAAARKIDDVLERLHKLKDDLRRQNDRWIIHAVEIAIWDASSARGNIDILTDERKEAHLL